MKQAILIRIDEFTAGDFCMSKKRFNKLLDMQHSKTPVTILGVGCDVDGTLEHDYHDIQLADGTKIEALSGYNLRRLRRRTPHKA